MTLNKRYLRNVKENLSFYVAAAVLTVVALLLFYLFYIAGTGIKSYVISKNYLSEKKLDKLLHEDIYLCFKAYPVRQAIVIRGIDG